MSITLLFFIVAFVLAGFVSAGVGRPSGGQCNYSDSIQYAIQKGKAPDDQAKVQSVSVYATLAMVCLLIVVITFLSLKETKAGGRSEPPVTPGDTLAHRQDDSMQAELL